MPNNADVTPILIERAAEQLRQEREIFEQRKLQESRWFWLRLVMGYSSIVLLVTVMGISSYILVNAAMFNSVVVTSAGAALFVDVLGLLISVWKVVLSPTTTSQLTAATMINLPEFMPLQDEVAGVGAQP